jgi:hypothetical protein
MRGYLQGKARNKKAMSKVCRIVARSELSERYTTTFEGMRMETRDGQMVLTGEVKDQPHLFGILERINGLGLELLRVEALSGEATERDLEPKP